MRHKHPPRTTPAVPFWSPAFDAQDSFDPDGERAGDDGDRGGEALPVDRTPVRGALSPDRSLDAPASAEPQLGGEREKLGGRRVRFELLLIAGSVLFLLGAIFKPWGGGSAQPITAPFEAINGATATPQAQAENPNASDGEVRNGGQQDGDADGDGFSWTVGGGIVAPPRWFGSPDPGRHGYRAPTPEPPNGQAAP